MASFQSRNLSLTRVCYTALMANYYAAYMIDEASRERLLDIFKPKYPDVIAHHITHKYGAAPEDVPPQPRHVRVVGYHDSGAIQVLVVDVDGRKNQATPDGADKKFYHITLALDRAKGVSPSKSNAVLKKIAAEQGEAAVYNLAEPVEITVAPKLLLDPPSFSEAMTEAEEILAQKTAGPNGVIAYAIVNDARTRGDRVVEPYFNPASSNPLQLAYAFFETNRVGVPVVSVPGGTQDLIATNPLTGETLVIELTKEALLKEALGVIGAEIPQGHDIDKLERYTAAKFIEKGWRVAIEDSFTAAVREAKEEQGIDLTSSANYIGAPLQFDRAAITKRTIDRLEKLHRVPLLDIRNAKTLADIKLLAEDLRNSAPPGVSAEAPQRLFAIQVPGFDGVEPVTALDQVENKIKGREGSLYYEKGRFVTLSQMQTQLELALTAAQAEEEKGNGFAGREIIATHERLNLFRGIEAGIVRDLQAKGFAVVSDVPPAQADTADNILTTQAGTASLPPGLKPRTDQPVVRAPRIG